MSSYRSLSLVLVAAALSAAAHVGPLSAAKASAATALAQKVNVTRADLPAGTAWASTPSTPNTAADKAEGRRFVACAQRAVGHQEVVSADPFGLGTPAGDIQADVSSPQFTVKNGRDQLPGISTEVVVTTAAQASADWRALDTTAVVSCVADGVKQAVGQGVGGKVGVATTYLQHPAAGQAGSGLGVRFALTIPGSKAKFMFDVWFYEVHQLEVEFTFVAENSPVAHGWETSVTGRVIARADHLTA